MNSSAAQTPASDDSAPMDEWDLLTEIVMALVGRPECVRIEGQEDPGAIRLVVHVAPEDVGKVVGRNGETVSIIRRLLGRISAIRGRQAFIQVAQPNWRPNYKKSAAA